MRKIIAALFAIAGIYLPTFAVAHFSINCPIAALISIAMSTAWRAGLSTRIGSLNELK